MSKMHFYIIVDWFIMNNKINLYFIDDYMYIEFYEIFIFNLKFDKIKIFTS